MISNIINSFKTSYTYIIPLVKEHECWLVDCGDVDKIIEQGWYVKGVLISHAHVDHIYGLNKLIETFPKAHVYTNAEGKEGLLNSKWNMSKYHEEIDDFIFSRPENVHVIENEGTLNLDEGLSVEVLFTPGHEPSCLSFIVGKKLFTGDAYIPGIKTVVTFPRSNKQLAKESEQRLKDLESQGYEIMAGHFIE